MTLDNFNNTVFEPQTNSFDIAKETADFDKRIDSHNKSDRVDKEKAKEKYDPDKRVEVKKEKMEQVLKDYFEEMKKYSDCPETIKEEAFSESDMRTPSDKEMKQLRDEYREVKNDLIDNWEKETGKEWPRYTEDVYIKTKTGELVKIREAGARYDAHHIQPLSMGGKNEASNITPLRADVHMDHYGVHSLDGAYGKMEQIMGG